MRWTTDAKLQRALDRVPGGDVLRYLLQRRVVRSLPIDDPGFERELRYAASHRAVLSDSQAHGRALELGAGRHLTVALQLAAGSLRIVATDVSPLRRPELVTDAARRIGGRVADAFADEHDVDEALATLGISYQVLPPSRLPGTEDASIDLVYSTSVLEHVPTDQLPSLFAEAARVLRPGGRLSCIVDYKDHYAYGDPTIGRLNFLAIPADKWFRSYSPPGHYQNRLRHHEMIDAVEAAGFEVEAQDVHGPTEADLAWLGSHELDLRYRDRPLDDLGIGEAHLVARKPTGDAGRAVKDAR